MKTAIADWRTWWASPTTREDRQIGAACGAIGGGIIGIVARILVGPLPAPWQEFAFWFGAGFSLLALLGLLFPKPVMLVATPFIKLLEGI